MTDQQNEIQDAEYTEAGQDGTLVHQPQNHQVQVFGGDPVKQLETAQRVVKYMAQQCSGEQYISIIDRKKYPKVEWWTTVGAAVQCYPHELSCRRAERQGGEYAYEAKVAVVRNGQIITQASGMCRSDEAITKRNGDTFKRWDDEYAVRSMAITRATAKAFRIGMSFMAVMADLSPTPAEEVPDSGFENKSAGKGKSNRSQRQPSNQSQNKAQGVELANNGTRVTGVQEAKVLKSGQGGRGPWTLHLIVDADDNEFTTFDEDAFAIAEQAASTGEAVEIRWRKGKRGFDLESIKIVESTPAENAVANGDDPFSGGTSDNADDKEFF